MSGRHGTWAPQVLRAILGGLLTVSGILLARTEIAARLGRRWRASCETALQSDRVGAAYEDGLACTPSPASRVSAASLSGCWLWGCTGWCAARCSCCSWPAQGAFTPTRQRSRASRLLRQGSAPPPPGPPAQNSWGLPPSPRPSAVGATKGPL